MKVVRIILFFMLSTAAVAQQDTAKTKLSDVLQLRGYIKSMQMASFGETLADIQNDNLIHNRLNFKIYSTKRSKIGLEIRNRVFFGESVDANDNYADLVDFDNGYVDMSDAIVDEPALVVLTQVDRLYFDWSNDYWEVRAGRQRINWGTNLYWNPNDVFNAYSLVDFDYEERPGVDAVRVQRHFKNMSAIDIAVKPGKDSADWVGAAMYRFNKWQYDFQVLAGWWQTDYVVGLGWAGNLKNAGFKGEASYFIPQEEGDNVMSASLSIDYIFGNQIFLTGGMLYNSAGLDTSFSIASNLFGGALSAKNLMPMKYSGIVGVTYPFSPIFSGGLVTIYAPGVNTAFFMPSLSYSMANNWELALFGQSFWLQLDDFSNIGNGIFLRIRGSF